MAKGKKSSQQNLNDELARYLSFQRYAAIAVFVFIIILLIGLAVWIYRNPF